MKAVFVRKQVTLREVRESVKDLTIVELNKAKRLLL